MRGVMTELTRQQRRDRAARRIKIAYLCAMPLVAARFATDYAGLYWGSVIVTLAAGACMLYGAVMLAVWYIGALLPDDWVNEWFD